MPVTVTILSVVLIISYIVHQFSARWIVLRNYRHLQNAVEAVQEVESLFRQTLSWNNECKHSVNKRIIFGFILVFSTVCTV